MTVYRFAQSRNVNLELMSALAALLLMPALVSGQARAWMTDIQTAPDNSTASTALHIEPGACRTIAVWVEDPHGDNGDLKYYDIVMPWFAEGGESGTLAYRDIKPQCAGQTVYTDYAHADWVFAVDPPPYADKYIEEPGAYFASIENVTAGPGVNLAGDDVVNRGLAHYVTQFDYCASADACGEFVIDFVLPDVSGPGSAFRGPAGDVWQVDWQPMRVVVGDPEQCPLPGSGSSASSRTRRSRPAPRPRAPAGVVEGVRSWMVRYGSDPAAAPADGPTSLTVLPGQTVDIAVYFEEAITCSAELLGGYQIVIPWFASPLDGATGAVEYVDNAPANSSDSLFIDQQHPDWLFGLDPEAADLPPSYNETPPGGVNDPIFGTVFSTTFTGGVLPGPDNDDVPNPGGPNYVSQFSLFVSTDATGSFELPFNVPGAIGDPAPPLAGYFNLNCGSQYCGQNGVAFQPLLIEVACDHTPCADADADGTRDDSCSWWDCDAGDCSETFVQFADIGGANGACEPDDTVDANDRFHALNCFSNQGTLGNGQAYPCEGNSPSATNVDAGGPFGQCCPDGVCDANDAFHAIHGFVGDNPCQCPANFVCPCPAPTSGNCVGAKEVLCDSDDDCPGNLSCNLVMCPASGPAPDAPVSGQGGLRVAGRSGVLLIESNARLLPGEWVEVDIFLTDALDDLRGYQLHVDVSGGESGMLELVDITIDERNDHAFAALADWRAFNTHTAQMLAGLDTDGIQTGPHTYLATYVFKASHDASGTFVVELHNDPNDETHRTFFFPTQPGARVHITSANAALIHVGSRRNGDRTRFGRPDEMGGRQ